MSHLEIVVRLPQNLPSGLILLDSNLCSGSKRNCLPCAISLSSCMLFIATLIFFLPLLQKNLLWSFQKKKHIF